MNNELLHEPKKWTGPALIKDLQAFLRENHWIAVSEMFLPGWDARVDVMAIKPHAFATQDLRIYEVKVSRSDFRKDEGANKWRKYLDVAHRVFFACPAGLLTKDDIPSEAGLIVRGPNGWSVIKAARGHQPPGLTPFVVFAMLFKVHNTDIEIRRLKERIATEENRELAEKAKNIGYEIRRRLKGFEDWDTTERLRAADRVLALCREITGLDIDKSEWRFREALTTASRILKDITLLQSIGDRLGEMGREFVDIAKIRANVMATLEGKEVKEL